METTIGIRGDSITMGARDLEKGGRATRLHLFLQGRYLEGKAEYGIAYNLGIDGDTSTDVLKRFDTEAEARQPNIIIFALGANDCVYTTDGHTYAIDQNVFRENMITLIEKAKKYTDLIIIVGIIPCDESKMIPIPRVPKWSQDRESENIYNNILSNIAKEKNVIYIDMLESINTQDLQDGSHPTAQGHEKMYIKIRDVLLDKKIL